MSAATYMIAGKSWFKVLGFKTPYTDLNLPSGAIKWPSGENILLKLPYPTSLGKHKTKKSVVLLSSEKSSIKT